MKLIWKHFIAAAFLPAAVAVPYALGYIMINAAIASDPPAGELGQRLMANAGPILPTVSNFWGLMWLFTAYCVIWAGVFFAMKIHEFYRDIAGSIGQAGMAWGKVGMKLPLIMPLIPGPKGMKTPLDLIEAAGPTGAQKALKALRGGKADELRDKLAVKPADAAANVIGNAGHFSDFKGHYKKIHDAQFDDAKLRIAIDGLKTALGNKGYSKDRDFVIDFSQNFQANAEHKLSADQKTGLDRIINDRRVRGAI